MMTKVASSFIGQIEPNDLFYDKAEVVVCDGFVGNILLKILESTGFLMKDFISSIWVFCISWV